MEICQASRQILFFLSQPSPLSPPVSEPLTNRGVLLSTLLHAILHPSHHLLNILLQIANKLGLSNEQTNKKQRRMISIIKSSVDLHVVWQSF
jgi:hypothetical protein